MRQYHYEFINIYNSQIKIESLYLVHTTQLVAVDVNMQNNTIKSQLSYMQSENNLERKEGIITGDKLFCKMTYDLE
jgi:hypothetical protein